MPENGTGPVRTEKVGRTSKETVRAVLEEIRPHFIFNVLHQLRYWTLKEPEKAYEGIYDLAGYLRLCMSAVSEETWVPLREEARWVKSYLNLEAMLHASLEVSMELREFLGDATPVEPGSLYRDAALLVCRCVEEAPEKRTLKLEHGPEAGGLCMSVAETGSLLLWRGGRQVNVRGTRE